jgi:hypothetical protein
VRVQVGSSQPVGRWWTSPLALLFLDGNHTGQVARHDHETFSRHGVPGGLLLLHDVFERSADGGRPPWHGYQRALRAGFEDVSAHGSLRVLRRPG